MSENVNSELDEAKNTVDPHDADKQDETLDAADTDSEDTEMEAEPAADSSDEEDENQRLSAELTRITQEHEQLAAMYSRLRADFDNFRRRTNSEKDTLKIKTAADVVTSLLPTIDNLERAVASADTSEGPLAEGVRLVLRQFTQTLEQKYGLEPIPSVGQPFDPEIHEAVERVDDVPDTEPGTIIDELQKGYRMGDVVLRPSIVRVAG